MKLKTTAVAGALVIILSGCTTQANDAVSSSAAATSSPSRTVVRAPTATSTPTPMAMSVAQASDYYLGTVCPANVALKAYDAAVDTYNASTTKSLTPITSAATAARDATSVSGKRFDDATVLWPTEIAPDIPLLRDSYFSDVSEYGSVASATAIAAVSAITFSNNDAAAAAAQRIRSRLGISSDTTASCAGR